MIAIKNEWSEIIGPERSKYFLHIFTRSFLTSFTFRKAIDHDDFPHDYHAWVYIGQKDPDRHEEFKAHILKEPRNAVLPGQYQAPEYDDYVLELK